MLVAEAFAHWQSVRPASACLEGAMDGGVAARQRWQLALPRPQRHRPSMTKLPRDARGVLAAAKRR